MVLLFIDVQILQKLKKKDFYVNSAICDAISDSIATTECFTMFESG